MVDERSDSLGHPEPQGIREILQTAVHLLRQHLLLVIGIDLSFIPLFLLASQVEENSRSPVLPAGTFLALGLLVWILQAIGSAALTHAASEVFLGRRVDIATAFWTGVTRVVPLVVTQAFGSVIVVTGLLLLIIPGVYLATAFLVVSPVVVIEGASLGRALGRSHWLMSGHMFRGITLVLVSLMVFVLVSTMAGLMRTFLPDLAPLVEIIGQAVATGYFAMVFVVFYYDLRSSKEGPVDESQPPWNDEHYPTRPRPIG